MQLTFLGTSAGVPTRRRNVSALALRPREFGEWLLFDCGEATQHQIMKSPLSLFRLRRIFLTHLHGDHLYGLFGLLASRGMLQAQTPMEIYGPPGTRLLLTTVMEASQLHLPYLLEIIEVRGDERFDFGSYRIETVPLSHSVPCYGYVYIEAPLPGRFNPETARRLGLPEGPLYGRLQRGERLTLPDGRLVTPGDVLGPPRPGRRIIIGGDNDRPELFKDYGAVDLMIHEATYTQRDFDRLPRKFRHSTARQLGITAQQMGVKRLIATHISPRYDSPEREAELLDEIRDHYDGDASIAYDFMEVKL
ncbi:ribonuclease Z [Nitratifractor sp.]